jgi:hypothetical protein
LTDFATTKYRMIFYIYLIFHVQVHANPEDNHLKYKITIIKKNIVNMNGMNI